MGQICDYFRAADAETASLAIASGPLACGFDTVGAKSIAPDVVLSQLIEFIRGAPSSPHNARTRLLWPPSETEPTSRVYDKLPENSSLRNGPYLLELSVEARDDLASVDPARLPQLAGQWAQIEEMSHYWDEESLFQLLQDLVWLASDAREAADLLYCWCTV
jgi:hypothetical protein